MSIAKIVYRDIAVGAEEDATVTTSSAMPNTIPQSIITGITVPKISTCEHNLWGLNEKYKIYNNDAIAFWSKDLSGSDCTFTTNPSITIVFDSAYTTLANTVDFDTEDNNFCTEMNMTWYNGSTQVATHTFYPDKASSYVATLTVESYNKLVIEFVKTSLPYRRLRLNKFMFGIVRTFNRDELRSVSIQQEANPISDTISNSEMDWSLDGTDNVHYIFQNKQPVYAYDGDNLIGCYYINSSKQNDARLYDITTQDAIGVLDGSKFSGAVYDGTTKVKAELENIVGTDFKVNLDGSFTNMNIPTGYIKECTRREALQQVCFAIGACVSTMNTDEIYIFPSPISNPTTLTENEIFRGSDVELKDKVTSVIVTAHTLTVDANGDVEINGTKYKDTLTTKTINNPNVVASDKENVLEVKEMTLINQNNLDNIANVVYNYSIRRNTMRAKIILGNHSVGDYVTMPTKWGDNVTGNIVSMDINLSNLTVADCEILAI